MASVKFPRQDFEKYIKLTKEVEEKISLLGTHLESVTDSEIEIEVLPNRPDMFSLQGFVRALSAFIGKGTGLKKYKVVPSGEKLTVEKPLPKGQSHAYACIVKGIKFDDAKIREVIQIQEKLGATLLRNRKKGAIGLYPLDKITFPVKFKGMKPDEIKFRPLEYPEAITGRQILSKHPTGREYAHLLEGSEVFPIWIDKKGIVMSMPPIINSHDVGKIDEKTTDVFIECTGTDPHAIKTALIILITALADAGGKVYSIECVQQNGEKEVFPNLNPQKMSISLDNANKLIGLNLKEKDLEKLLPRMGYDYEKGKVFVPAWRSDVIHEVDIIEDIAIAYGYENLIPEIPKVATMGEESPESKLQNKIASILTGLGLLEVSSLHLIKPHESTKTEDEDKIELEDSKTEYKLLRPNLAIPALRIFSENKDNEYPQRIFEIGTVFSIDKSQSSETGIKEETHLLIGSSPGNFTELKQILDYLTRMLGLNCELKETEKPGFIDGRIGSIIINGKECGHIGEIHPETLREWSIKMPLSIIEMSLESLFKN